MSKKQEEQNYNIVETEKNVEQSRRPIYIRTLNVFTNPAQRRYERHYKESKKHLAIDLIFIILILLLITANIILMTKSFPIENVQLNFNHATSDNDSTPVVEEVISDTELILNSSVVYYNADGDQLGFGAWPPSVDEITQVRIFVSIKPSMHAIKNINLKIKIPASEMWKNDFVVDTGDALIFDEANNLIYWQIDQLAEKQKAQANFVIQIEPSVEDLNNKIKLIDWISSSAIDMLTGNKVEQTLGSLYSPKVE